MVSLIEVGMNQDLRARQVVVDARVPHEGECAHLVDHLAGGVVGELRVVAGDVDVDVAAVAVAIEVQLRVGDDLQLLQHAVLPLALGHAALAGGHQRNEDLRLAHALVARAHQLDHVPDFRLTRDDSEGGGGD